MNDHALDALLAEYAPPPLPAGLVGRAVAAALALPQQPRPSGTRPRHDRRKAWLRRPLLIGSVALGLAVSGALAASLAGIRLDRLPGVAALLAGLPFADSEVVPTRPPPPASPRPAPPVVVESAPVRTEPVAIRPVPEPPAVRVPAIREEAAPIMAPTEPPRRAEPVESRRVELPPPPIVRREEAAAAPAAEPRAPAPAPDEQLRLQREQIERTERVRAARQAQIERLQRIQQRRERIRRLRRD